MAEHDHREDHLGDLARRITESICDEYGGELDEANLRALIAVGAACGCVEFYGRGTDSIPEAIALLSNALTAVVESVGGSVRIHVNRRPPQVEGRARGAAS